MTTLYLSPNGNDAWSGRLPEPNAACTDGPMATLVGVRNRLRYRSQPPAYWGGNWQPEGIDGPVTVLLRGGVYPLRETLAFGPEDSAPVTYAAYPGETPILEGGRRLTGWREETVHGRPCWVADLPEVARGEWFFRSLFVNGARRARPRLPKADWFWIEDVPGKGLQADFHEGSTSFIARDGDIQPWRNLTDVEAVVLHYWNDEHMPIVAFDPVTHLVTSSRRSIFPLRDDSQPRFAKYYVQNVFEALTEPGEWYLDRVAGRLYYLPMEGETPETTAIYAPCLTQLLAVRGDAESGQLVHGLRFVGLTLRHTDAVLPPGGWDPRANNPGEGMREWPQDVDYASAPQAAHNIPGAIVLTGARGCAFEDCRFEHLGWYGVEIGAGCRAIRLVGNELSDLGAGGVKVTGADIEGPRRLRTGDNVITDNHIHHGGRVFHQAVGIFLQHTFGNVVAHNHIHDLYYSGISCGWVWGFMETVCRDNRLEKNHIHHLGFGWLSDMGGIYTLGVQPGTTIRGNLIHDVERANYGGWGVYLDEGSSHIVVENNVTYNTSTEGYVQHYGRENFVRNNIFVAGREGQVSLGRTIPGQRAFTFQHNLVVSEGSPCYTRGYGSDLKQPGFAADYNLFWCTAGPIVHRNNAGEELAMTDVQALGLDRHSLVADPLFVDFAGHDFALTPESPAHALGFQSIDLSDVGPRK
jgi:hypothetical protein